MSPIHRIRKMAESIDEPGWKLISEWGLRAGTAAILAMGGWIFLQVLDGQAENRIAIAAAVEKQAEMQRENATAMMDLHKLVQANLTSIREINANRFTVSDALSSEQRHFAQMDELKTLLSAMERRLPTRTEFDAITLLIRDLREDLRDKKGGGP